MTIPVITLCWGLMVFLAGLELMRQGLYFSAGGWAQRLLARAVKTPASTFFWSILITAVLQSSSMVTVLAVLLADNGLINLSQALTVVLGANVGTCLTIQILAWKLEGLALPLLATGILLLPWKRLRPLSQVAMGWGLIFTGFQAISAATLSLARSPVWKPWFSTLSHQPWVVAGLAAVLTGLVQSSSAVVTLTISLVTSGLVGLKSGIAMILGANVGTCSTTLLSALWVRGQGRAVAWGHFWLNLLGALLVLPLLGPFAQAMALTSSIPRQQLANAHFLFNLTSSLIMLPLIPWVVRWLLPPPGPPGSKNSSGIHYFLPPGKAMVRKSKPL